VLANSSPSLLVEFYYCWKGITIMTIVCQDRCSDNPAQYLFDCCWVLKQWRRVGVTTDYLMSNFTVYRALYDNIIIIPKATIAPDSLGNHVTLLIGQCRSPRSIRRKYGRVTKQPILFIRVRHRPVYFNHNQLQQQRKT